MADAFHYQLFGLRVGSEIPLPELFPATGDQPPDVIIRRGSVGELPSEAGVQVEGDQCLLLTIPGVGRYRIRGGQEILVDAAEGVPDRNVRLYLLGSAFGALLHQRGLLPLHANAIEVDGKAVAFMGEAGAGKSTLAAWFHDRGFRVIADDVCVVQFDADGKILACPGIPRLRLWEEALRATGREAAAFPRSYVGDDHFRKFDVSIEVTAAGGASEIAAIFLLGRGDAFSVGRLGGLDATTAVFENTYRGWYVDHVAGHQNHWSAAIELVRRVPIYRLSRIWNIRTLDEQGQLILETVRLNAAV